MPEKIDLKFAIGLPPEKAVEYFKSKGYAFSWDWTDVWKEAHAKAFTVAKVARMDVLQDIRGMVQKAISDGITFEQFRKELEPRLKAKGWWGKTWVGDEKGGQKVQLGSPWRLKTIFETNVQTAYMAGRYQEMMGMTDTRPYWEYVAVLDGRTRPWHRALHGLVFRFDDPFWNKYYPPNGFKCRCRVRSLSEKNMQDRGLSVSPAENIPGGSVADVGWDYNPGKAAWQPELDKYDYDIAKQYIKGAVTGPDFERFFERKTGGEFPVAVLNKEYQSLIGADTQTVLLSENSLKKNIEHHPEILLAEYQQLPEIIASADLIIKDGETTMIFLKKNNEYYFASIKATISGQRLFLTSFRKANDKTVQQAMKKGEILKNTL